MIVEFSYNLGSQRLHAKGRLLKSFCLPSNNTELLVIEVHNVLGGTEKMIVPKEYVEVS